MVLTPLLRSCCVRCLPLPPTAAAAAAASCPPSPCTYTPTQASVLPTPSGNVAVLGPSVDELRHLLATCRTALTRGVYEPCWCGACGGRTLMWPPAADVGVWRELLQAAEQLISV